MLKLPNITLIAVATRNVEATVYALEYSSTKIEFEQIKLVSHYLPDILPDYIRWEQCPYMESIDDWNHYMFYSLWKHVDTDFGLVIHPDGFVINPDKWRPDFLNYDYIGAAWSEPVALAIQGGRDQELVRVGNSVSIRSRRLMKLPSEIGIGWQRYNGDYNEDTQICAHNRKRFVEHGMTFAPVELAVHFSREEVVPEGQGIEPFAFHKHHNPNHPNWNYPKFV